MTETDAVVKRLHTISNNIQKCCPNSVSSTNLEIPENKAIVQLSEQIRRTTSEQHKGRVSLIRTDDDGAAAFDSDLVCIGILI